MGQARTAMDAVTKAYFSGNPESAAEWYAQDAVGVTPDWGEVKGPAEIVDYMKGFFTAFPDAKYEPEWSHESGDTAIDEGWFVGTNTGPLQAPDGTTTIPATGKRIRVRGCDIAECRDGKIVSHRFYFDQMDFLGQLGLVPETPPA